MSEEAEAAIVSGEPIVLSQRGQLNAFFRLSLRNGLLNLVTLTLYRFWGKTAVRRLLWSTTYLNEEPFEYTGRGIELFVGFLLALAVLVLPFLIAVFGAQFLGPAASLLVLLPLYAGLLFLLGFGRFTAFRYLATRTTWRGVRFHMRGTARSFALSWIGYMLLSIITLGWFWPAADRRLAGRLWNSLSFGDHDFKFRIDVARNEPVYGAFVLSGFLGTVAYLVYGGIVFLLLGPEMREAAGTGASTVPSLHEIILFYISFAVLVVLFAAARAPFHSAMLRSVVAGIGFRNVRFRLKLDWIDMAVLTVTNMLILAVSFGFMMPLAEARARKLVLSRLKILGEYDLGQVSQAQGLHPRTGEGLADAFGIITV